VWTLSSRIFLFEHPVYVTTVYPVRISLPASALLLLFSSFYLPVQFHDLQLPCKRPLLDPPYYIPVHHKQSSSRLIRGLLSRSQYSEGPATGHLDTGFSRFPCVYEQMLRGFPRFQVATTRFSCCPPDLNLLATNFVFCIHAK